MVRAAGFEPARTRQDAAILEIAVSAVPPRPQIGTRGALERDTPLFCVCGGARIYVMVRLCHEWPRNQPEMFELLIFPLTFRFVSVRIDSGN